MDSYYAFAISSHNGDFEPMLKIAWHGTPATSAARAVVRYGLNIVLASIPVEVEQALDVAHTPEDVVALGKELFGVIYALADEFHSFDNEAAMSRWEPILQDVISTDDAQYFVNLQMERTTA